MKTFVLIKTEIIDNEFNGNEILFVSSNIEDCETQLLKTETEIIANTIEWYETECEEKNVSDRLYQFIEKHNYSKDGYIDRLELVLKKEKLLNAYYLQIAEI